MLSPEIRIARAPETAYAQLVAERAGLPWWQALGRPFAVLIAIAVIIPITALHLITATLVLTVAASWSVAVVFQCAGALLLIAAAPARRVSVARAFDLWFAGHLPYNAWLLLLPFVTSLTAHSLDIILLTLLVPVVWSPFVVAAFCRTVLGAGRSQARRLTAVHQTIVVSTMVALVLWDAGGIDNILGYLARWRL